METNPIPDDQQRRSCTPLSTSGPEPLTRWLEPRWWKSKREEEPRSGQPRLPGLGLRVDHCRDEAFLRLNMDPVYSWRAKTLTRREACMIAMVEELSNKPDWWLKIRDTSVADKWKKEAIAMDWTSVIPMGDFTPGMADACISEMHKKADIYEKTGLIPVMDFSGCAVKSDSIMAQDERLVDDLKAAVAVLEEVPSDRKDWHPGSDHKVLDLVHPSLWPLVYGRSRVLRDRRINVAEALDFSGKGTVIPRPTSDLGQEWSDRFQWLPCEVDISGSRARIASYVNNLHPVDHADLYPVLERFIDKALPAWDFIYRFPVTDLTDGLGFQRIQCDSVQPLCKVEHICTDFDCLPTNRPLEENEEAREDGEEYEDWYEGTERQKRDQQWYDETHPLDIDDPDPNATYLPFSSADIKTSGFFGNASRIQVIVKLANIHLTPESPTYDGGSWHTEGMRNERICATALYYYDSENISESRLHFRTWANGDYINEGDLDYQQDDHHNISRAFNIDSRGSYMHDVGSVVTRSGRALFFPNLYQHRVAPFRLADPSRPGHRKILALFLVDPVDPVISTANVPPQQRDWWARQLELGGTRIGQLPAELRDVIFDNAKLPMDEKEAKKLREELMSERKVAVNAINDSVEHPLDAWNFCEH